MKNLFILLMVVSIHFGISAQIPKKTLIEMTTSTQCHFCPRANRYIDSVALHSPDKSVVLRYQSPFSGYDPILFQDSAEINHRLKATYGDPPRFGLPGAGYNGKYHPTDPYEVTTELIDSIYLSGSHFNMTIQHKLTTDYDSLEITLAVTCDTLLTFEPGKLKAFVLLMEDSIVFPTPPGSNGEKEFYFECRKFISGSDGMTLPDSWSSGMTITHTFLVPIPDYIYDLNNLYMVAFIQDMTNFRVLQSEKDDQVKLPSYAGINKHLTFSFPPFTCNPVLSGAQVVIKNMGTQPLINFSLVYQLDQKSSDTIHWTGLILPDSMVTIVLPDMDISSDGQHVLSAKVILPNGHHVTESFATYMSSIIEQNQVPDSPPLHTYFTNPVFPYKGWCVFNPNRDGNSWRRISYQVMDKPYFLPALQLRSKTMSEGTINEFILPDLDISQLTSMALSFDVAHIRTEYTDDTLKVFASTDCGSTWIEIFIKNSHDLAFTSVGQFEFIDWLPDTLSGDWKSQYIDLSSYAGNEKLQMKFQLIHQESNDIYIRNIFLGPNTGIDEKQKTILRIHPNPATEGFCIIDLPCQNCTDRIQIIDMLGSVVYQTDAAPISSESIQLNIENLRSGMYIVKVANRDQQLSGTLVIRK